MSSFCQGIHILFWEHIVETWRLRQKLDWMGGENYQRELLAFVILFSFFTERGWSLLPVMRYRLKSVKTAVVADIAFMNSIKKNI